MCACFRMWYMNCQQCASGTRKSWSSQKKLAQLCTKPLPTCYYHLQLFSQRKKFRLLPIGHMLLSFLLVFLMLECLSLCNVIWWLSWQRHDNSDDVMKMLCLFATQTEVWSRRMTCGWSNWAVAPPTQMMWLNYWQWWWWWWWHISYLSRAPRVYSCKFFLAGVNFYRFNAKNWNFRQILREEVAFFTDLTRKIGVFRCKFYSPKILPV